MQLIYLREEWESINDKWWKIAEPKQVGEEPVKAVEEMRPSLYLSISHVHIQVLSIHAVPMQ